MDLRDVRYFLAAIATQNLSRAARVAHVAQPALSRAIRLLEDELGVPLLERHPKGVVPTAAGSLFAAGAEQLMADTSAALDRAEATAMGRRGRVVLSASRAAIARGFPSAVQASLHADHPEITLAVQDYDPPTAWEAVLDGRADVGVSVEDQLPAALVAEPLWVEALNYAMLPVDHSFARRDAVAIAELGVLPMIVPRPTLAAPLLDSLVEKIQAAGLRSPILLLEGDLRAAHLAVAAGRGWTLMAESRITMPPAGTAAVRIHDLDTAMRTVALWRRTERRPVVHTVLARMYQVARGYASARVRNEPALPPLGRAVRSPRPAGTVPVAIELRHLRAIDAVAAAQTIGRAAERLGLSQPALSRQLRDLEHAAGVALLERSARGVTLTDAGASLAGDVPALLATAARLPRDVTRAKRGMEGRCVVGVVATSVTTELLSSVITRSALRYPHVHIVVVEKPTPQQPAAIFAGEIDLGLAHVFPSVSPETHDGLVTTRMHEDRLDCALLAADHPLARRRRIDPRSLATVPFLFMERGFHPGFYDRVFAELRALGLEPLIEATYDSLQQVWSLIGQGRGWGLGFHSHIERPPAGTTAIPITKLDLPWGIELLGRRAEASVAVRAVVDVFREARQLRRRHAPARGRRRKYR